MKDNWVYSSQNKGRYKRKANINSLPMKDNWVQASQNKARCMRKQNINSFPLKIIISSLHIIEKINENMQFSKIKLWRIIESTLHKIREDIREKQISIPF